MKIIERKLAGDQDMLDWLIEASGPRLNEQSIINRQLGISFAAIHTTTNHMTNVLFDLAARWDEYAPALIAEYHKALEEDGGVLQKTTISKLSKLDSFMKESMRLNPPSSCKSITHFLPMLDANPDISGIQPQGSTRSQTQRRQSDTQVKLDRRSSRPAHVD
jgi:cytochrome P450